MQRKWRRAWLRGKPHYMRHKPVRKVRTGSIKSKVYNLTAKAAKKLVPAAAAAGIFLSSLTGVQANPAGGSIAAGTGSITGQGTSNVTINQTSDKLAINWNSFNIGSGEKVQFIQPGTSSIALNRVLGSNASSIYGQLSANGKVFLLNPNGVLFAKGAQVNVGGLVASTLNLSDKDFMNGKYIFSGDSQQGVLNQGNITAANGGYVALLGANAANEGVILAKEGTVALGAGSKVALDFTGDGLLTLSVDESKVKAEVKNSGLIKADGGLVVMNAKAADALTGSVVNNTGTIEAKSVTSKNGTIILTGDTVTNTGIIDASGKSKGETGGTVKVLGDTVKLASGSNVDVSGDTGSGKALIGGAYQGGSSEYAATKTVVEQGAKINADALTTGNGGQVVVWADDTTKFAGSISAKGGKTSGDGGNVETSGKKTLSVTDTASVNTRAVNGKTGNWLLDPLDFTVAPGGDITGETVSGWLANNNVTIKTTDSGSSAESGSNKVTGNSGTAGDIKINDAITWHSGTTLTLSAYNNIYINRSITNTTTGSLALEYGQKAPNPNNTGTYSINAPVNLTDGQHFSTKLGSDGAIKEFTVITSLGEAGSTTGIDLQGISGNLSGNYFLGANIDAIATKNWNDGAGFAPIGPECNTPFKGTFDGGGHTVSGLTINRPSAYVTGLFGRTDGATIANVSLVNASIKGEDRVGTLAGTNSNSQITNCYATGSVEGTRYVGGLVGSNKGGLSSSYATSSVKGAEYVGGLVGLNADVSINSSYATGSVKGTNYVGGLVGGSCNGSINNSYATGSVEGTESVGGLAGGIYGLNGCSIKNSYATGSVTGSTNFGGLVGNKKNSTITDSYWNTETSGQETSAGGTGKTTAELMAALPTGFDSSTWGIIENTSYPYLKWRYADTPQVVSGTVVGATAGQIIQAAANGSLIGSTTTGANGFYYLLFDNNTIADNTSLLTYVDNSSVKANAVTRSSGTNASITGLTLADDTVNVSGGSSTAALDVNNLMTTAKGSLTDEDILYTTTGTSVTVPGNLNVTAAGDLTLGGDVTAPGSFILTAVGNITAGGAVNVGTFDLKGGTWQQVGATLPTFSATDFRISGGTFIRALNGDGTSATPYQISDVYGLQGIGSSGMLAKYYTLVQDIDASATKDWNSSVGFTPLGNSATQFKGTFDGGGHTVSGLTIHSNADGVGLFGYAASSSKISNVGLVKGSVTGTGTNDPYVGALVGRNYGSITNSYNSGSVTGTGAYSYVGGLVGHNQGSITNSYNTGSVIGTGNVPSVGGLVGWNTGNITSSYNTGKVTVKGLFGGLVGQQGAGGIEGSYWDINSTGQAKGVGNKANDAAHYTGLTSDQMKKAGNFSGWADLKDTNGNNVWYFYDGYTAPLLRSFLTPLTVSADSVTKVYDGSAAAAVTNDKYTPSTGGYDNTKVAGDLAWSGSGNVGSYGLSGLYTTSQQGYLISYDPNAKLTINPKALSATQTTAVTKIYNKDNTATFDGNNISLNTADIIGKDIVNIVSGTGTYDSVNAGGRTVTVTGVTLDNANYKLEASSVTGSGGEAGKLAGHIDKKALSASQAATVAKTYDKNDSAVFDAANITLDTSGVIGGDIVSISGGTGTYDSVNAGDRTITVTGVTLDNANYKLDASSVTGSGSEAGKLTGHINQKALTANQAGTVSKTYDKNASAVFDNSNLTLNGVISGDTVSVTGSGTYDNVNAGDRKITVTGVTLDNGNYSLAASAVTGSEAGKLAGHIDKKALSANQTATVTKTYDKNDSAVFDAANITLDTSGVIGGDIVSVSGGTGTYDNVNAGDRKITVTGVTLDNANYKLEASSVTGSGGEAGKLAGYIDKKALSASQAATVTKTYDKNASAVFDNSSLTLNGVISGDTVSVSGTGTYDNVNAGDRKITVTGVTLDNANYKLEASSVTGSGGEAGKLAGHIDKKALSASQAATVTKTYDKNDSAVFDAANITLDTSGVIGGDTVSVSGGTGTYDNVNAGARTVTVDSVTLDNGNYSLSTASIIGLGGEAGKLTGQINQRNLTITAAANTKIYDGKTTAAATPTYTGLQEGDSLTGLVEAYTDQNTGSGKTLTVTGYNVNDGNNGGNYTVSLVDNTAGKIDKAALTVTAKDAEKIYDKLAYTGGNEVAYDGFVNGEDAKVLGGSLTYSGTSQGATEVGSYTITPAGLTATNYTITFKDGTLSIKPATITDPGYIAAVKNTQQNTGDTTAGTGETSIYPPKANAASKQLPDGRVSPIQYSRDNTGTPRVITTAGQTVTIAQDSPVQLATNPVQKEIAVYQTANGSTALAGAYHVDASQGSLALRESAASFAPVSPERPASAYAQAETSSFQLTDSQGNTANFTIAYTGGSLYVQVTNAAAADLLSQNRQLITAASLVAAQDKLSIDINNLQAVYLEK